MECTIRNQLVLSYLLSQADEAEMEIAARKGHDAAARDRVAAARNELAARRKELLDHCSQHGC